MSHSYDVKGQEASRDPEKDFECCVCTETYDQDKHRPVVMKCRHVACESCVKQLQNDQRTIQADKDKCPRCPLCRSDISKPSDKPFEFAIHIGLALPAWRSAQKIKKENDQLRALLAAAYAPKPKPEEKFPVAEDRAMQVHLQLLAIYNKEIAEKEKAIVCLMIAHHARVNQLLRRFLGDNFKNEGPKSLDKVDPKLIRMYKELKIPPHEYAKLAGVAVDPEKIQRILTAVAYKKPPALSLPAGKTTHYLNDLKDSKRDQLDPGFIQRFNAICEQTRKLKSNHIEAMQKLAAASDVWVNKIKANPLEIKEPLSELKTVVAVIEATNSTYIRARESKAVELDGFRRQKFDIYVHYALLSKKNKEYKVKKAELTKQLKDLRDCQASGLKRALDHTTKVSQLTPTLFGGTLQPKPPSAPAALEQKHIARNAGVQTAKTAKDYGLLTENERKFCDAIRAKDFGFAADCLSKDPLIDVNCVMSVPDEKTLPVLLSAIDADDLPTIEYLLLLPQFDVNMQCNKNVGGFKIGTNKCFNMEGVKFQVRANPLSFAALMQPSKVFSKLLDCKKTEINIKLTGGRSPLHNACFALTKENVKALVERGADLDDKGGDLHRTPVEYMKISHNHYSAGPSITAELEKIIRAIPIDTPPARPAPP